MRSAVSIVGLAVLLSRFFQGVSSASSKIVGNPGVSAQALFLGNDSLVYILDKTEANPLQINGASAISAAYNWKTNTTIALKTVSNQFCAGGSPLGDGSWLSAGGNAPQTPTSQNVTDGRRAMRVFHPGRTDDSWEDENVGQLQVDRWYPTNVLVNDGSNAIIAGFNAQVFFPNKNGSTFTLEFYPSKGDPQPLNILSNASPYDLYPFAEQLSDGRIFIVANKSAALYDYNSKVETALPNMPTGPRNYPDSGANFQFMMGPESNWTERFMFCGGTQPGNAAFGPVSGFVKYPSSNKCESIAPLLNGGAWTVEDNMPGGRVMGIPVHLPTGEIVVVGGGGSGLMGFGADDGSDGSVGGSYADAPVLEPWLYRPTAPAGQKWIAAGGNFTVPRLYHSSATLLPDGSVLIAGSNPHWDVNQNAQPYPTEYRVEVWYPDWFGSQRPDGSVIPNQITYGGNNFTLSGFASTDDVRVRLIRTGFSTHALMMSQKSIELRSTGVNSAGQVTVDSLPNNPSLFQPGPALAFLVVNGIPSVGKFIMVGSGKIGQ